MSRLLIHVEGQTEESFVNEVLGSHLCSKGFESVGARIVGNARIRERRGGIRPWPHVRRDIIAHMKEDPSCIATTMVDFHGLPARGSGAWPGRAAASGSSREKERHVEDAVMEDVVHSLQGRYNPSRFVPFVVMHEFEALLFSDCAALSRGIGRPQLEGDFMKVRLQFDSPEDINDDPDTAPSKRVSAIARGYEKPLLGALAILEIGLDRIRAECAHFDGWITRLETIVSEH